MNLRFRAKILLLFGGLVVAMQAATLFGVLGATEEDAARRTANALRVGAAVFHADLADREAKLLERVRLLSRDFAFIEAVATLDSATLQSVLANHGDRAKADLALLLSVEGAVLASSATPPQSQRDAAPEAAILEPMAHLLERATAEGQAVSLVVHDGSPYQAVVMPVYAPRPIAWLCMGFVIDDAVAESLENKTLLEVSFFSEARDGARTLLASTLPDEERANMTRILSQWTDDAHTHEEPFMLPGTGYLTISVPLAAPDAHGDEPRIYAAIQTSMYEALEGHRRLRATLLAITCAALVVASLLAAWIARSVTHPIRVLVAAAQRISTGDYTESVALGTGDELGLLARTMNEMQAQIFTREQEILYQTSHDPLTGLYSRAAVHERIARAIEGAARADASVALLIVSIQRFKEINDKFGHPTGDAILRELAAALLSARDPSDVVVRLGGDEFLVILGSAPADAVAALASDLARNLAAPMDVGGIEISLSLNVGVALYPDHGDQSEVLMRRADIALLSAKRHDRDVALYEPGQDEEHLRKLTIIGELSDALARGEFQLYYQPKVDVETRDVRSVEALLRWTSPKHGNVRPDEFIPWAEECGKIHAITEWVLEAAIAQCADWRSRGLHLPVAVNLSALDATREDLPEQVSGCLARHGLPSSFLILEVTETAVMQDLGAAERVLDALSGSGIEIALDDFGTGHSSLAQLKRLRMSELKIDRSFVCNLKEGSEDACIVRCAAEIGHGLGMLVVAEGVEDARTFDLIRELGGDLIQGYHISRPLPPAELEQWLHTYYCEQVPPSRP